MTIHSICSILYSALVGLPNFTNAEFRVLRFINFNNLDIFYPRKLKLEMKYVQLNLM